MSTNQSPKLPINPREYSSSLLNSSNPHNPIHPHDTYNLPGVIRYLQLEWSRAEANRIDWANDRAELKSIISKLTGEIRSLKEINRKLQDQVDELTNNKSKKSVFVEEDYTLKLHEPNIHPLLQASKYLKDKKLEIDMLLKDNVKPVNEVLAIHKKHVLSLTSDSSPIQISEPESKNKINVSTISTTKLEEGITETIKESEEDPTSQSEKKKDQINNSELIAELLGHHNTITEISLNGDTLLSCSKDGMVKIWNLLDRFKGGDQSIMKINAIKTLYNPKDIKFLKWINEKFFMILIENNNTIKCYNSKNFKNVFELKLNLEKIISIDVCETMMVLLSENDSGKETKITYYTIEIKDENLLFKEDQKFLSNENLYKFVKIDNNENGIFYGYDGKSGSFEQFNILTKKSISLTFIFLPNLSNLKIFKDNKWLFIFDNGFKLYHKKDKKILYEYNCLESKITNVEYNIKTKNLLSYHNNGTINIHNPSSSSSSSSLDYQLTQSFNHYDPIFSQLSDVNKSVFDHSWNLGLIYDTNICITAGEDMCIRLFKFFFF